MKCLQIFFNKNHFRKIRDQTKNILKNLFLNVKISKERNSFNIQKIFSKCKRKEERNSNTFEGI